MTNDILPPPAENPSEWIRISCAALCRIKHADQYLLLLNANRREKGLYVLSPIGGALTVHDPAIFARWAMIPEKPGDPDLRGMLPVRHLDQFREWFNSGAERERSPFRELYEELVTESKLLPDLKPSEVSLSYLWTHEEESLTQRSGQTGMLTHYFMEIYDVRFTSWSALALLLAAPPDSGALWVTEAQMGSGSTLRLVIDGAEREVHVSSRRLFSPSPGDSPRSTP